MEVKVLKDALKHGISVKSIMHCLNSYQDCSIILRETSGSGAIKRLIAGFDHNANPIEVIALEKGGRTTVIHAMKLRPQFYDLLQGANYGK